MAICSSHARLPKAHALFQQLVDAVQLLAEYLVIDIAHDRGQGRAQMRLKRNYNRCHVFSL